MQLASNDEVTVVVYDAFSLATGFETLGGTFGDDITFKKDNVVLNFGVDSDVTITHDPDDGLIVSGGTGDDNDLLTLQTGETETDIKRCSWCDKLPSTRRRYRNRCEMMV